MKPIFRPSHLAGRRTGFTLIELLVVIAIIALLAAILFPVFGRARENARRSSCQSNLKQLGLVMLQYAGDYDELYPQTWNDNDDAATTSSVPWMLMIQPYVKNTQILQCPAANGIVNGTVSPLRPWRDQIGNGPLPVSYAYNLYIGGQYGGIGANYQPGKTFGVKKGSQILRPAETVMLGDSGSVPPFASGGAGGGNDPEQWNLAMDGEGSAGNGGVAHPERHYVAWILVHPGSTWFNDSGVPSYGTPTPRHLGTSNILWADGHVKATKVDKVMDLTANADYTVKPTTCFNPARGCTGTLN